MSYRRRLRFRWNRAIARRIIIASSLVLAPVIVFFGVFIYLFVPIIPGPDFPPPRDTVEARLQDIAYAKRYAAYDRSFSESAREARYVDFLTSLEPVAADLTKGEFELAIAEAVAMADNAHTNVTVEARFVRLNQFPIRLGRFREGLYVLQATKEQSALLGMRLVSLSGVAVAEIEERLLPYFGGRPERARYYAPLNIGSPEMIHALGIGDDPEVTEAVFEDADGSMFRKVLRSIPPEENRAAGGGKDVYVHAAPQQDVDRWVALMEGTSPPPYLANPAAPFDRRRLPDEGANYIRVDVMTNVGSHRLNAFLDETLVALDKSKSEYVVVDLRFNPGGRSTLEGFAEQLSRTLPADCTIYVLTSGGTFSYGIAAAAMLKYHAPERTRIVGESVGDRLRFWANGGTIFRLPNSGIEMRAWSSLEDYAQGCWDWTDCFWFSPTFRRRGVESLDVDIPVQQSISDYLAGRDSYLKAIRAER